MPKYDSKSLEDAAKAIGSATVDTYEEQIPAGGSQYGSWDAMTVLPAHEQLSLYREISDEHAYKGSRWQSIGDFSPEPHEVFLTKGFFETFDHFYDSAISAVTTTAKQADYGARGLYRMSENRKAAEDANLTSVFGVLDKMKNRD
ncbi:hypothetical protein [Actinomadura sp. DC4]|uniref:hypothetical protein n=1 Tax=Actinomadura sp. DC4 TaxID=3055069 RepID=UPI0025B162ED|nr:hypothetical protein [Actinomadura sp. DC4]MDN3354412.1 hypothetical protein [Actinomadura sp. DC4]